MRCSNTSVVGFCSRVCRTPEIQSAGNVQLQNLGGVLAVFVEIRGRLMNRHAARAAVEDACGIAVPSGVNGGSSKLHDV